MKKSFRIRLGPVAILFTVITMCLSILAVLTISTASADMKLSGKFADTVTERYELERKGQELLKEIDACLYRGDKQTLQKMADEGIIVIDGDRISAQLEKDSTCLTITVSDRGSGSGGSVEEWRVIRNWEEDVSVQNIWDGK